MRRICQKLAYDYYGTNTRDWTEFYDLDQPRQET